MRAALLVCFGVACSARMSAVIPGDAAPPADAPVPACTQPGDCPVGDHCAADQTCASGCGSDADCAAGKSCCGSACVDTTADADNCGACGTTCGSGAACCTSACTPLDTTSDCGACGHACGSGDSCTAMQCIAPVYPAFCANKTVDVLFDGISSDINAAALLGATFDACDGTVTVQSANETDATLVDQTTGALLGGSGVTYVFGGGPFADKPVQWLETTEAVTPIYFAEPTTGTYAWMQRGNATPVATMLAASCTVHLDQFVVEWVTDMAAGSQSLIGYGACGGGTFGAAYFYADVMLANVAMYPDRWYVVSWTDTNNDSIANAGDTFTVLAHGN